MFGQIAATVHFIPHLIMKPYYSFSKNFLRTMYFVNNRFYCKPLLQNLAIMPLPSLYIFEILIEIYKNISLVLYHYEKHNYETRKASYLIVT